MALPALLRFLYIRRSFVRNLFSFFRSVVFVQTLLLVYNFFFFLFFVSFYCVSKVLLLYVQLIFACVELEKLFLPLFRYLRSQLSFLTSFCIRFHYFLNELQRLVVNLVSYFKNNSELFEFSSFELLEVVSSCKFFLVRDIHDIIRHRKVFIFCAFISNRPSFLIHPHNSPGKRMRLCIHRNERR